MAEASRSVRKCSPGLTVLFFTDSDTYQKCRAEVEEISRHTLFTPVARQEAVQAMVLVSGWSSNGWLPGGHAVRMGLEIGKCGGCDFYSFDR